MCSHRNVIGKYAYRQCLADRNRLSSFCNGFSKYGRTSLYDFHPTTLKMLFTNRGLQIAYLRSFEIP